MQHARREQKFQKETAIKTMVRNIFLVVFRSEKALRDLSEGGKIGNAADRVERRLKEIERGMNAERNHAAQLASDVATDILRRSQSKLVELLLEIMKLFSSCFLI